MPEADESARVARERADTALPAEAKTNPSMRPQPMSQSLEGLAASDIVAMHARIDKWLQELTGPNGLLEVLAARVTALERFDAQQRAFQKGLREVHSLVTALFLGFDRDDLQQDALRGRNILVVEDDHVICRFLRRLLEARGAIVLVTNDAVELRHTVGCSKTRFDCVLIDANLGSDDGIELARWLLDEQGYPTDRLVLMTGGLSAEQEQRAAGQRLTVLAKPFTAAEMVAAIVKSLNHEPRAAP